MKKPKGLQLVTNGQFFSAMLSQTPVIVWMKGKIVEYGGIIEKVDNNKVNINGMYYVRSACEFRMR